MSDKQLDTIIGKMDEIKETLELSGATRHARCRRRTEALATRRPGRSSR